MNKKPTSLKEGLIGKIPQQFLEKINRSFEIVGNIAICEIEDELIEYETIIAQTLLDINKHITTVVKKDGFHGGVFRTQKMKVIGGVDTKIATYKENDVILRLNIEEVYFSTRLSTEREKLAKNLNNDRGNILILFSGSGPYTYVLTRKNPNISQITSIEINPLGHQFASENLELNKNNLKKSNLFKELILKFKEYKLPIYEKHISKHLNSIIYQFYNIDANLFNPQLNSISKKSDDNTNNLISLDLNLDFKKLYQHLKELDKDSKIEINYNRLKNNEKILLSQLLVLFSDKFSYELTIKNNRYLISSLQEKNYLLQVLRNNTPINECLKYDEIYMPLPKDAELFLPIAFSNAKKNCIIHMYDFVDVNEFPQKSENTVKKYAIENNVEVEILQTRKVGQYSPKKFRVCCDFKIL